MPPIITAENLSFQNIIQYPRIEIEAGKASFISGDSGSGKSTLLKLMNGIASPQTGTITYNGGNIADMDTIALRKEVLLVSQSVYLFDKTIKENFADFHAYRDLPAPCEEKMREYMSLSCADFPLDTMCTTMSGGERQRVYLAVFLSFMPKVLMLDEPTSALDAVNANRLMQNLKAFCCKNRITLIVVSHDRALAGAYADHIITLERGA